MCVSVTLLWSQFIHSQLNFLKDFFKGNDWRLNKQNIVSIWPPFFLPIYWLMHNYIHLCMSQKFRVVMWRDICMKTHSTCILSIAIYVCCITMMMFLYDVKIFYWNVIKLMNSLKLQWKFYYDEILEEANFVVNYVIKCMIKLSVKRAPKRFSLILLIKQISSLMWRKTNIRPSVYHSHSIARN